MLQPNDKVIILVGKREGKVGYVKCRSYSNVYTVKFADGSSTLNYKETSLRKVFPEESSAKIDVGDDLIKTYANKPDWFIYNKSDESIESEFDTLSNIKKFIKENYDSCEYENIVISLRISVLVPEFHLTFNKFE